MGVDDGSGEKETEGCNERKRWEKGKRGRDYMTRGGEKRREEERRHQKAFAIYIQAIQDQVGLV